MSTSTYHHGDVRESTLGAARQMLATIPASQISLREVARAAGISHAAPYKHFAQRSDFLAALAARCMTEFIAKQSEAVLDATNQRDRLVRLGTAYVEYGLDHRHAFALIFDPVVSQLGNPPSELVDLIDQHTALLHETVADSVRSDLFPGQNTPAEIATALWAQVHGLTQLVILGHIERARVSDVLHVAVALAKAN